MLTWIFSEMLPANGLPLSSRNGFGVPGLKNSKTPTKNEHRDEQDSHGDQHDTPSPS